MMSKNRCQLCAYYEECRNVDLGCENGEYFYPEDNMVVTTEATRSAGRRFFHSKKSKQRRKHTTIDQFLDDLEYERRFFLIS